MSIEKKEVRIPAGQSAISGDLHLVKDSKNIIIFAHGSGSSRFSKRNLLVANLLQQAHFSTFLFDLLTPEEEEVDEKTREFRFDIEMLGRRLILVTEWIKKHSETKHLKIGYFGASTGAAAALTAAAQLPNDIKAVVSRGGRPDLALEYLKFVKAPTLFIVGELDADVIALNTFAYEHLKCEKDMQIIGGASHLFEEPGTLEQAADAARSWFLQHMMHF
jgi:putative phosphoribosyl transferase